MTNPIDISGMADGPVKKKRRKPTPVTAWAMRDARELGFVVDKVEQRVPRSFVTRDFINAFDLIAFQPDVGILGIQVTGGSGGNHAARVAKVKAEPRVAVWLASGARAEVWSYSKRGERGKRKLWTLRREEIKP